MRLSLTQQCISSSYFIVSTHRAHRFYCASGKHCSDLSLRQRGRGAVYYPTTLNAVYQAAQNMATNHLQSHCNRIPSDVRQQLCDLRERRDTASGGKQYWADACSAVGLVEDGQHLRFAMAQQLQQQQQQQFAANNQGL